MIAAGIVALVVVAFGQLGASSSSARTETQIVSASDGVVQSTVSGTGSLEPVTDEAVDFQTSGTLSHVYVKDGEYVHKGQLLATLHDRDAALTLQQAKVTLAEARSTLASDEKTLDSSSSSTSTSYMIVSGADSEDVNYSPDAASAQTSTTTPTTTTPTGTGAPTGTVTTGTTTTGGTGTTGAPTAGGTTKTQTTTQPTQSTTVPTQTVTEPTQTSTTPGQGSTTGSTAAPATGASSTGSSSTGTSSTGSGGSSTVTAATVDADKLQVVQDEQTVREDRQALDETRLRAPVSGTITSVESISPGDSVSSGSTSSGATSSTSTTGSTGLTGAASTSSGSSSSSSSFVEIDSLKRLSMTVSFTEADINKLKVGQTAVVTLDALSNLELGGKVTDVSAIGTTSNSVTSYDATVTLDQYDSRVKPGMSASAEVIVRQARGVTVPSGAVTGTGTLASVKEDVNGRQTTKKVIVGLRGDSRDLIVSGVSAGAQLVETTTLPSLGSSASASSSSSSSSTGGLGGRSGFGGGLGGAGFPSGGGFSGPPGGGGIP